MTTKTVAARPILAAPSDGGADIEVAGHRPSRRIADGASVLRLPLPAAPPAMSGARLDQVLGVLLDAAQPGHCGGRAVLRPLWAEEAMHRAYSMLQLAIRCRPSAMIFGAATVSLSLDGALATDLAAQFNALAIVRDDEVLPCARLVRGVAQNLVALFGPGSGDVVIETDIEPVSLPAYKRRALVLAASELVVNALRHAFRWRHGGRIELALKPVDASSVRLTVRDDGVGVSPDAVAARCGIAAALAGLLEAELVYRAASGEGTIAEIVFQRGRGRS